MFMVVCISDESSTLLAYSCKVSSMVLNHLDCVESTEQPYVEHVYRSINEI